MFNNFPREVACPSRHVVYNWEQMQELINKTNGKTNVFTTIYSFKEIQTKTTFDGFNYEVCNYSTAIVDKLFFDFANEQCYENVIKMHNYLLSKNIKHAINCSGRKYHLYIFVKNSDVCNHLKDAIYNAEVTLCKELNFTYGQENHNTTNNPDIDSKLMGNLAGLTRIPNTFNPTANRYCIKLNKGILLSGHTNIQELAKRQQYVSETFGTGYLDLTLYDIPRIQVFNEQTNFGEDIPLLMTDHEVGEEHFYPCVYKMITEGGYNNLFNVAIWLRDKGFTYKEADLIFKKYLSGKYRRTPGYGDDYEHSHIHDKTLETVYSDNKDRYLFPNCSTLWQEGNCPGKCKFFDSHYAQRKLNKKT